MSTSSRFARILAPFALATVGAAAACGGGGDGSGGAPAPTGTIPSGGNDAGTAADTGMFFGNPQALKSITVDPPTATVEILNGSVVGASPAFKATAHFSDNSTQVLGSNVTWSVDDFQPGAIDGTGLYKPNGSVGGLVNVTATYKGMKGAAQLTVKLHIQINPGNVSGSPQSQLKGATVPDASVVWAYPYNGTVFPRGLAGPTLMWMNGGPTDDYYVHVTSPTFEYESFATVPPPARFAFDATAWQQFVDSTNGAATLSVARFDGTKATVVAKHTWTIAPASMRGTVYYWANNSGRVIRLKPGSTPSDFSAGVVPPPLTANGCTMACHTVSADGSTLVAAGGTFGGSYDLVANKMGYGLGGAPDSAQIRQWGLAALSPNGKTIVLNAVAAQLTGNNALGAFKTSDGSAIANSGLGGELMYMPSFSPDASKIVYVTGSNPGTTFWLTTGTPGTLRAYDFNEASTPMFANSRDIVQAGSDPKKNVIAWPTVSPDGRWALYARLAWVDPTTQHNLSSFAPVVSDLYMADLKNPGTEIRLGALDGDGYPFAAGARDLQLNYEPSFAPVASGGYFWVVLHSRRTYGNVLTGDRTTEKQLWVAAIDQNPQPGKDPSHPGFWLPGQDTATLNLRGFFALDPCKGDGQGCMSGTDCCGGYCDGSGDGGAPVCRSAQTTCAQNGDRCQASSDCCNAAAGVTCINRVCSEPPPR